MRLSYKWYHFIFIVPVFTGLLVLMIYGGILFTEFLAQYKDSWSIEIKLFFTWIITTIIVTPVICYIWRVEEG